MDAVGRDGAEEVRVVVLVATVWSIGVAWSSRSDYRHGTRDSFVQCVPEGASTQILWHRVPKTIMGIVLVSQRPKTPHKHKDTFWFSDHV